MVEAEFYAYDNLIQACQEELDKQLSTSVEAQWVRLDASQTHSIVIPRGKMMYLESAVKARCKAEDDLLRQVPPSGMGLPFGGVSYLRAVWGKDTFDLLTAQVQGTFSSEPIVKSRLPISLGGGDSSSRTLTLKVEGPDAWDLCYWLGCVSRIPGLDKN